VAQAWAPAAADSAGPPPRRAMAGLEENVRAASARLLRLQPAQRPASLEKLTIWLRRAGCCAIRLQQLVQPATLARSMLPLLDEHPKIRRPLQVFAEGAADAPSAEACADMVQASAKRAASSLVHMADVHGSFVQATKQTQYEWLCSQAFGTQRCEPPLLAAELLQNGMIALQQGHKSDEDKGVAGGRRLVYCEERLRGCPAVTRSVPWDNSCFKFQVRNFDPWESGLGRAGLASLDGWMKKLGCQISLSADGAAVTMTRDTQADASLQKQLAIVVLLVAGKAAPVKLSLPLERPLGVFIGRGGERMQALQKRCGLRLRLSGTSSSCTLMGWATPAMLPKDASLDKLADPVASLLERVTQGSAVLNRQVAAVCWHMTQVHRAFMARRSGRRPRRQMQSGCAAPRGYRDIEAQRCERDIQREAGARRDAARRQRYRAAKAARRKAKVQRSQDAAQRCAALSGDSQRLRGGRHKGGERPEVLSSCGEAEGKWWRDDE